MITTQPSTINKHRSYTLYIWETFIKVGIPLTRVLDLGYEPDYQGCLLLIEIKSPSWQWDSEIDKLSQNELNMGDDSFTITKLDETKEITTYLIDICQ